LVLDHIIQLTERDEFLYQEMITMLPLNSHPNPQNVLIIGGGDGGVMRDAAKHHKVTNIIQCEIDEDVVNLSKQYLPFMAVGYENEKAHLVIGDGFEFLKKNKNVFDVIITDSTDPIGPGQALFQLEYFQLMYESLKNDGIMCSQGQNIWLETDIIKQLLKMCKSIFPVVSYANGSVPTYTNGQIGYILCSKNPNTKFEEPLEVSLPFQEQLRHYTPEIHRASFALPYSIKKEFDLIIGGT